MTRRMMAVWFLVIAIAVAGPAAAQTPTKQEVEVRVDSLAALQDRLNKTDGPVEIQARGLMLNDTTFFTVGDFGALVSAVQQRPGAEVELRGVMTSADGARRPFEAKVETGEVELKGLTLTPDQFKALATQLQNTPGIREFKIRAVVDGQPMSAKFENENGRLRIRTEMRDGKRDHDSDSEGRGRSRVEKAEKVEKVDKIDRPERVDKVERVEKVDRIEKPERSDRH